MKPQRQTKETQPLDVFECGLQGISNIEASAGTGKTWAICGLYLRLIAETDLSLNQILVVTFTNAAAAELNGRIREKLVEVLHALDTGRCPSGDPFAERFLQRMDQLGGDYTKQASSRLKAALSSFEEAAIFTIHSFCQRTLGDVPFAAAQPFVLEVEADDDELIMEAAADCWRRIVDRYDAAQVAAMISSDLNPEWIAGEFKRLLDKPLARIKFSMPLPDMDRNLRRAAWLKRVLIRFGPAMIRAAKRRRRVISYHDMLYNLYDALTGGHLPSLIDALRLRYPAALIDEFQDTDPLQFEIFRSIYEGHGALFLVGDPKQAIYAFRNADLNTYLAAKRKAGQSWTLEENQRSEEGLISAVNALFGSNLNAFCNNEIQYRSVSRGAKPIKALTGDTEVRAPMSVWLFEPGSKDRPVKSRDAEALALHASASEISRLIHGGRQGQIKIGPADLQPRDIAVLVRTRKQGQAVKEILSHLGIGSVDLMNRSVFATLEAAEMERILRAVAEPSKTGLVRGALATVLFGAKSMDLAALNADENALNHVIARMNQYRLVWVQSGFGVMWRKLLTEEKMIERLLSEPGGERRITNLRHLMELLTAAEETHPGMESLIRWLGEKRTDPREEDAFQLRLESDENLVQIVTKHRAKGLEWPIVFCPFIWKDQGSRNKKSKVLSYHEGDQLILDYTGRKEGIRLEEAENSAERVRLIYVAATRAINRCYIAGGPFWQKHSKSATDKPSKKSLLNWIVAGEGESPGIWAENKKVSVVSIHQSWHELLSSGRGIEEVPWPSSDPVSLTGQTEAQTFQACHIKRLPAASWRLSSYSSLTASFKEQGAGQEPEPRDYDATLNNSQNFPEENTGYSALDASVPDIIDYPAGVTAGHCLHAVFERIDFQDDSRWPEVISEVLSAYPPNRYEGKADEPAVMIRKMLDDVLSVELPGGFALNEVSRRKRLTELEFACPVEHLNPEKLNALLARHGRRVPPLNFSSLEGFLRGFIDLVFEHNGRWYVLDWKSNKTGLRAEDYSRKRLDDEMFRHAYDLQGLIYLTALHRFLKLRLPGYAYQTHIGGMLYVFVRGVKPAWPGSGIWNDLPDAALIESLDALFSPSRVHKKEDES